MISALGNEDTEYMDSWRNIHPNRVEYTHINSNVGASRIDRIYLDCKHKKYLRGACIKSAPIPSDHKAVMIHIGEEKKCKGKGKG